LLLATAVLLVHLGLARNLPRATAVAETFQCLNHSQTLLSAVRSALQRAQQTLEFYSCTPEEIDYEDITKDKTSTVKACVPLELVKNESCLASGHASFITIPCLNSIYEDLKLYQVEFQAMNAKLLLDPTRQIFVDQNMLSAIDELMQALNASSEPVPQEPSLEEPDFYQAKVKFCILLHAFRIRAVTIDRMMSYLSSS
ncbi:Interleukin-12 subunit alpha, partial [Fukomys damarensis]